MVDFISTDENRSGKPIVVMIFSMLPLKVSFFLLKSIIPSIFLIARIFSISKEKLQGSLVEFISGIIKAKKVKFKASELLILLPRCLQNNECKNDVIFDITRCTGCGKCDIVKINTIIKDTNVKASVVTGGSQARDLVAKYKPKAIIAVACERELVSGIFDTPSNYVIGVINLRPNGPCFNTKVSIERLKESIYTLIER